VETQTITLAENLKPYAKYVSLVDKSIQPSGSYAIKFTASRPVRLLMLRLNQDATVLYAVNGLIKGNTQ
jgi:hypothetical protein